MLSRQDCSKDVLSSHHLVVDYRRGCFDCPVTSLRPFPISRGRWTIRPLCLQISPPKRESDNGEDDDVKIEDRPVVALTCDSVVDAEGRRQPLLYIRVRPNRPDQHILGKRSRRVSEPFDRLRFRLIAYRPSTDDRPAAREEDVTSLYCGPNSLIHLELALIAPPSSS